LGDLEVSAYFKPASECGGDWWGSIEQDHRLILLIGDATGHGVPAALITAAAHSCATTLKRLAETLANLPLTPSFIMDSLNAAIFHAGRGRVKMTFFVAVIDTATGQVQFANASHELPLICRDPGEGVDATKEHLDTFDARPDPCLGESLDTVYHEHTAEIGPGDTFVLYTDGIIECQNAAKEEYGERRLSRSLLKAASDAAAGIKERLVTQALAFYEKPVQEDDITVVVVKRARSANAARIAS
jgi:sigma-B regulation protein RsbU (phosphoserine phosphatase)